MSTVAVTIAVYNEEALIDPLLDALLVQTRPPEEIVLVDDGSTDRTADASSCARHASRASVTSGSRTRGRPPRATGRGAKPAASSARSPTAIACRSRHGSRR